VRPTQGGPLQGLAHPVGRAPGARRQHLAAADLGGRAPPQPGTDVLDAFEPAQVGADLAEDLHHRVPLQSVDAREVCACPVGQVRTHVEFRSILAARSRRLAQLDVGARALDQQPPQLQIPLAKMRGDVIMHPQRLLKHEQVVLKNCCFR